MNRAFLLLLAAGLTACATPSGPVTGPVPLALADCPSAPHCVSSLAADEAHRVAPFLLGTAADWPAVVGTVREGERTTIVQDAAGYLHAEVLSPWHFYIDDLELKLDGTRVDVRSSSRIGYYDFDVNRKRVEALREALVAKKLLRSASQ